MRYLHTMVRVEDLERALDFYCKKLGLVEVSRREDEKERYTNVFLKAPGDDVGNRKAPLLELTYNWGTEKYTGGRNFGQYKRIVVKVGTSVLSKKDGPIDTSVLKHLVEQVSKLKRKGVEVILVTSGAVGTGRALLSARDSSYVPQKQMYAAVGQVKLMSMYAELFAKRGYLCAQALATKEDFRDREHYMNMKNCFEKLLHESVIPIVNENDVVAITELVFTDNDELAGFVAAQLHVDAAVVLTSVDGFLANGHTVPEINAKNAVLYKRYITPEKSSGGRRGIRTKFNVALKLAKRGITAYIVNGKKRNALIDVMGGRHIGTKFLPRRKAVSRKR